MLHKRHKLKVYATQEGIQAEPFSFKKIWDFAAFFQDPVRLGNREETPYQKPYRAWGSKIGLKNRELNGSDHITRDV